MRPKTFLLPAIMMLTIMHAKKSLAADRVAGNLIQFNENGAWCWYQDPRLVFDPVNNTLLISSIATAEGLNGKSRAGDVDIAAYNFDTGLTARYVLHHDFQPQDDHNAAAFLIRNDGRYLAMYARHNHDNLSYWRISSKPHDISQWGDEQSFDWTDAVKAAGARSRVTYSNLFYLPAEGRTYDLSRAINDDPSILISSNQGEQWTYAAKLLTQEKLGYVNGYTKYASNGRDRIDFITTEHHPRDFNNSIYHGYIQAGRLHKSDGTVVEKDIFNSPGHSQTELTQVFAANSMFDGTIMTHAWTISVAVDSAGRPYALISARADDQPENTNFDDHRFFYARFDGTHWQVNQLAKAGACLWDAEQDYTGLAALDPSDPDVVFISSTVDPRDDSRLNVHEIFQGRTANSGKTWTWTPITSDSNVDNLRPLAVASGSSTVLVWFRGTMSRSQHYDSAMVGLVIGKNDPPQKVQYVAATSDNTAALADDPSTQKTTASGLPPATYDVFAYFWSDPTEDIHLGAGLSADRIIQFRPRSCQAAETSQFASTVKVADSNRLLYRAYLGRMSLADNQPLSAFVNDPAVHDAASPVFAGIGYLRTNRKNIQ